MGITIEEIESAIEKLSPDEFSEFSEWFEEFEQRVWDRKIAGDLESGKFQDLIAEAEKDLAEENYRQL
jgi:hypothetical protein